MGQFVETIDGISQSCRYLNFPVVSGNVSFYNETNNQAISPTPTIGAVGIIKNLDNIITKELKEIGSYIFVVGKTIGHLYQSEFFREVVGFKDGPPPEINLFNEKNNGLIIQTLISKKIVNSVHDISSGGLLLALTEMCLFGKIGVNIKIPSENMGKHKYLFGEDQSRYLLEINEKNKTEVKEILEKNSIFYEIIGITQKENLSLDKDFNIKLLDLNKCSTFWFKNYFEEN